MTFISDLKDSLHHSFEKANRIYTHSGYRTRNSSISSASITPSTRGGAGNIRASREQPAPTGPETRAASSDEHGELKIENGQVVHTRPSQDQTSVSDTMTTATIAAHSDSDVQDQQTAYANATAFAARQS